MNNCQNLNKTQAEVVMERVARKAKVGIVEKNLTDLVSLGGDRNKGQALAWMVE